MTEELAGEEELHTGKSYQDAFAMPQDHPQLPNVLLIGDSISVGYTVDVRKLLMGRADVFRIPTNGRYASYGLEHLDQWLGSREWDVIHFNWGLWDICYRNPLSETQGHRDKVNGALTATPEQYRESPEKIVERLKQTGAALIWCTTTPVPEFEAGRKAGDEIDYNRIAEAVMREHDVQINDLHSYALKRLPEISLKRGDVHFTDQGYAYLAEKVAQQIASVLPRWYWIFCDRDKRTIDMNRPNVLIFCVDQMHSFALGCNRHPDMKTPSLNRLTGEGRTFRLAAF